MENKYSTNTCWLKTHILHSKANRRFNVQRKIPALGAKFEFASPRLVSSLPIIEYQNIACLIENICLII